MRLIVKKSQLTGKVVAPPSKSYSHRALIIGSCARRPVTVHNLLLADDVNATIEACRRIGAKIEIRKSDTNVTALVHLGRFTEKPQKIDARKSGTTLRFILGVSSVLNTRIELTGHPSLQGRPIGPLVDALQGLGTQIEYLGVKGFPPVASMGGRQPGTLYLPPLSSSQFISAILISSPLVNGITNLEVSPPKSMPYLLITQEVMEQMGFSVDFAVPRPGLLSYRIQGPQTPSSACMDYVVHGDWSSAAMLLAAGTLAGSVTVEGLYYDRQGDQAILEILKAMGADVTRRSHGQGVKITAAAPPDRLEGIHCNCADTPDLVPVIAALASKARGKTVITGAEHLRLKESNRLETLAEEFRRLGVRIKATEDGLLIVGPSIPSGIADSHGDHRLAMSLILLGLASQEGVTITGSECIRDSYPTFTSDLKRLGAKINEYTG
ncbi:MAG: 3-phosphoshikimate 1-carboxyvinyltransferase [Candidatus Ranarchaeia archaeon]